MLYFVSVQELIVPASVAFQPLVDLDTGTVVAVETHTGPSGESEPLRADPAVQDVRRAIAAARATAEVGTLLPLQLLLRAETVAHGQPALATLHNGLRDAGRRPHEVIVCVHGGFAPAQRQAVSAALQGLRSAGYLVGFAGLGTAHAPLDLLFEVTPYLLKLDPEPARKAATDPRRSALVEALVGVAHRIGTHILAPGLTAESQAVHLRELGVRLVQGPLLAGPDWRPGMRVTVPVPVQQEDGRGHHIDLGARVSEYTLPAVTMPLTATADEVLTALNAEGGTTSVVLVDEYQRPKHSVDRTRFLLAISGAYGHALHAHKAAARLADPPRLVPKTVPAIAALRAAGKEGERVYDDLVVTDEVGRCLGIVRVSDLIRSLSP